MALAPQKLDRRSVVKQVRDDLRDRIVRGELATGDQLPGEVDCAVAFGVSRATVRESYKLLEQEGLIFVRRGHGRYVSHNAQQQLTGSIALVRTVTEFLESSGYVVGTKVLSVETRAPTPWEAEELRLDGEARVVHLQRLRLGNGIPLVFSNATFAASLVNGRAEEMDWSGSVIAYLRTRGCRAVSAVMDVQAVTLPEEVAVAHDLELCRPWMLLTGGQLDADGRPFLLSRDYFRGDIRTLHIVQRTET